MTPREIAERIVRASTDAECASGDRTTDDLIASIALAIQEERDDCARRLSPTGRWTARGLLDQLAAIRPRKEP